MRKLLTALTLFGGLGAAHAQMKSHSHLDANTGVFHDPTGIENPDPHLVPNLERGTRGPGAGSMNVGDTPGAAHGPAVGHADPSLGHVPTDQELAEGATPAIVELPPVPHTLEWSPVETGARWHPSGHE